MPNLLGKRRNYFPDGVYTDGLFDFNGDNNVTVQSGLTEHLTNAGVRIEGIAVQDTTLSTAYDEVAFARTTYTSTSAIAYTGTTNVETTIAITLQPGTYVIGYSVCMNLTTLVTQVWIADAANSAIDNSKLQATGGSSTATQVVGKAFKHTVASTETYHIAFNQASGSATTDAITMTGAHAMFTDPEQAPQLWAFPVDDSTTLQASYTAGSDLARNNTTLVDVVTLAGATVGTTYVALWGMCTTPDSTATSVYLRNSTANISGACDITAYTSGSQAASGSYGGRAVFTATDTDHTLSFVADAATTNVLVPASFQIPTLTLVAVDPADLVTAAYTGALSQNFTGTTPKDASGMQMYLTAGWWMVAYSLPVRDYTTVTSIYLADASDAIVPESKMYTRRATGIGRSSKGKTFVFEVTEDQAYQVKYVINSSSTTTAFSYTTAQTTPVCFAMRITQPNVFKLERPLQLQNATYGVGAPATGTVYYDTGAGKIKVWTGAAWETVTST